MKTFETLFILAAQITGFVIISGGRKKCPNWIRIIIGIGQVLVIYEYMGWNFMS